MFCGIASGPKSSAEILYEVCRTGDVLEYLFAVYCHPGGAYDCNMSALQDDRLMVFADIRPAAAVHLLVVPKLHIPSFKYLQQSQEDHALGTWTS